MFGRYKRLVPHTQRRLIADQRLPHPNWFVGAAEQPFLARDPELLAEVDAVEARIAARNGADHDAAAGSDDMTEDPSMSRSTPAR